MNRTTRHHPLFTVVMLFAGMCFAVGCGHVDSHQHEEQAQEQNQEQEQGHDHDHAAAGQDQAAAHDHAAAGPHGGTMVAVEGHAVHLEFIHDLPAGKCVFYLTGQDMTTPVNADAPILINIKTDQGPKQIATQPVEKTGQDTAGFEAIDPVFKGEIHKGQVVLNVNGKQYFVPLPDHDHHEGYQALDHDHGESAGHEHDEGDGHDHGEGEGLDDDHGHEHDGGDLDAGHGHDHEDAEKPN